MSRMNANSEHTMYNMVIRTIQRCTDDELGELNVKTLASKMGLSRFNLAAIVKERWEQGTPPYLFEFFKFKGFCQHLLCRPPYSPVAVMYRSFYTGKTKKGRIVPVDPSLYASPSGLIKREKMLRAAKLLSRRFGNDQTVKEVARKLGAHNTELFGRQFKKFLGVTPGRLQRICRDYYRYKEMRRAGETEGLPDVTPYNPVGGYAKLKRLLYPPLGILVYRDKLNERLRMYFPDPQKGWERGFMGKGLLIPEKEVFNCENVPSLCEPDLFGPSPPPGPGSPELVEKHSELDRETNTPESFLVGTRKSFTPPPDPDAASGHFKRLIAIAITKKKGRQARKR